MGNKGYKVDANLSKMLLNKALDLLTFLVQISKNCMLYLLFVQYAVFVSVFNSQQGRKWTISVKITAAYKSNIWEVIHFLNTPRIHAGKARCVLLSAELPT